MSVTENHEEKETLVIDVTLPGHDQRVTTPLFERTRAELIKLEDGRSFVTGKTAAEAGSPLESHHFFIERCLAEAADWDEFRKYVGRLKSIVDRAHAFCEANPELDDIMTFVDDQTVNGMLIEKHLHTGAGEGIHAVPFPLWQFWCYGKDGFKFSGTDCVYHEDEDKPGSEMPCG
jgi:hypothetical protein